MQANEAMHSLRERQIATLREKGPQFSVSLLTANWMNFSEALKLLQWAGIRLLHFDIMDGRIWPKLTAGAPMIAGLKHSMLNDVHLLVENPEQHIDACAEAGADMISFSVEAAKDIGKALMQIESSQNRHHPSLPILRGVSLNPETPLSILRPYLHQIDFVVLLAVAPSTGKQIFLESVAAKCAALRALKPDILITCDGGVRKENLASFLDCNPDILVTGSAIFDGHNAIGNLRDMLGMLNPASMISSSLR